MILFWIMTFGIACILTSAAWAVTAPAPFIIHLLAPIIVFLCTFAFGASLLEPRSINDPPRRGGLIGAFLLGLFAGKHIDK